LARRRPPPPGEAPQGPPRLPTENLSSRHARTLAAVFEKPTRADIPWRDIEALFKALEAELTRGRGSRVRVLLNGRRASFHRPHPQPTTDKGAVGSVRRFLTEAGATP
jgi:hypothetical protein